MKLIRSCEITCSQPKAPGFGPPLKAWTKAECDGYTLSNCLEQVEWSPDPFQVFTCEGCGIMGCKPGGWVRLSRVGNLVLFTRGFHWSGEPSISAVEECGSILLPVAIWERWRESVPSIPQFEAIPVIDRATLAEVWISHTLFGTRAERFCDPSPMTLKEELVACDRLQVDEAILLVQKVLDWRRTGNEDQLDGTIQPIGEVDVELETLYFSGSSNRDWTAFAWWQESLTLAFGSEWVFLPRGTSKHWLRAQM